MTEMVDLILQMQRFAWPDYLVFVTMLILCILIGIYFGFAQKSSSETEYLMGGRNMMIFPIALSLIARYTDFLDNSDQLFNAFFFGVGVASYRV